MQTRSSEGPEPVRYSLVQKVPFASGFATFWYPPLPIRTTAIVFVFPDGATYGDIERFVWERALVSTPIGRCVEDYTTCLLGSDCAPEDEWKSRVLAFTHAKPGDIKRPNARQRGERVAELVDASLFAEFLAHVPKDEVL